LSLREFLIRGAAENSKNLSMRQYQLGSADVQPHRVGTDLINPDAVTDLGTLLKSISHGPQNEQDVRLLSLGR
jgi:hypothetical protein